MARNDDYGWVAEKKRAAMREKLARRGMPGYVQLPVSERYGVSYTGMGGDGTVDRSAPAGFDASTDPPHIYHEGELRVSTPEGVAYMNADIAPTADPGAVEDYRAQAVREDLELAGLGPRKDAKKRFQGTRGPADRTSLSDLEGSGEYPSFRSGGAVVGGIPLVAGAYRSFGAGGGVPAAGGYTNKIKNSVQSIVNQAKSSDQNIAAGNNQVSQGTTASKPSSLMSSLTKPVQGLASNAGNATMNALNGIASAAGQKIPNSTLTTPVQNFVNNIGNNASSAASKIQAKDQINQIKSSVQNKVANKKTQNANDEPPPEFDNNLSTKYPNGEGEGGGEGVPANGAQEYIDRANEPLEGGSFLQNPYTQKRIGDMRQEGASRQSYLRHQQAMNGTDANAAWAQSMMQAAATEEGINNFAAQAHAQDWSQMLGMANEWLGSGDPALIAQGARVMNYYMPGSGIDFTGLITNANAEQFGSMYNNAISMSPNMSEGELAKWMENTYGDKFDRSSYPALAAQIKKTQLDREMDELFESNIYKRFVESHPEMDSDEIRLAAFEVLSGYDWNKDGKIGNEQTGASEVPGAAGSDGAGQYVKEMGINTVQARNLANQPPVSGKLSNAQEALIDDILESIKVPIGQNVSTEGNQVTGVLSLSDFYGTPIWDELVRKMDRNGLIVTDMSRTSKNAAGATKIDGLEKAKNSNMLVKIDGNYYAVDYDAKDVKTKNGVYRNYTLTDIKTGQSQTIDAWALKLTAEGAPTAMAVSK